MKSKITGDDYEEQLEAYQLGEAFSVLYKEKLDNLPFENLYFGANKNHETIEKDIEVEAVLKQIITLNDIQSMQPIMEIITLIQTYNETIIEDKYSINSLFLTIPAMDDYWLGIDDLSSIHNVDMLNSKLLQNIDLVNIALLEANKQIFLQMEKDLKKLGYSFKDGVNAESIFCYGKDLIGMECNGYSIVLDGNRDEEKLFKVITYLQSLHIPIEQITIPGHPQAL